MQMFSSSLTLTVPISGAIYQKRDKILSLFSIVLLLICTGISGKLYAQGNLVLNPSFEIRNSCPIGVADLGPLAHLSVHCANWKSANEATPDYFHACTQATCSNPGIDYLRIVGVPQNTFGQQTAFAAPGDPQAAYAGIIYSPNLSVLSIHNRREYIEGMLSTSLEKDQIYDVSFYVSLAEGSTYALTDLGAYLLQGDYVQGDMNFINVQPQVRDASRFFNDMNNWVQITGRYKAQGGEDRIIIGYFRNTLNATIDYQVVTPAYTSCYSQGAPSIYANYAYYYIDNVSVSLACRCGRNGYSVELIPDGSRTASSTECCYRVDISRAAGACDIGGIRLSMLPNPNGTPNKFSQKYGAAAPWALTGGTLAKPIWSRNPLTPWQPTETVGGVCVTAQATPRFLVIEYLDAASAYMCADTIPMPECNLINCCDSLKTTLSSFPDVTSGTCCYSITSILPTECSAIASLRVSSLNSTLMFRSSDPTRTPVSSITFGKFSLGSLQIVGGDLCLFMGSTTSYPVRLEYMAADGTVLCSRDTTLNCQCHCGAEFYSPRIMPVHNTRDNECCWTLALTAQYGACPLYGVTADIVNSNGTTRVLTVPSLPNAPLLPTQSITLNKFCMASTELTGEDRLRICYFDQSGMMCCDTLPLRCLDCCEKFHIIPVGVQTPLEVDPESCCKNVYITRDSGSTCDIYEVRVFGAVGGIPRQLTPITFLSSNSPLSALAASASYCLEPGERRIIRIDFLNLAGDIVCSKTLVDSCAERQCCDSISLGFEYPISVSGDAPDKCCASIYAIQSPSSNCKVYGVLVTGADGGIPYDSTRIITFPGCGTCPRRIVANYCLNPGETRTILIEFLDKNGNTMCVKSLQIACPPVDSCCDKLKLETHDWIVPENSCCKQLALSSLPGLNCAIYGVRLIGSGSQGGIPLQSTPITLPPYNPFALSTLVLGTACAPVGTSNTTTIEFLDANGNVLCTKTIVVSCLYPKQQGNTEVSPFQLRVTPNPSFGNVNISYVLATDDRVKVELYTAQGDLVATPEEGIHKAGNYTFNYSTNELSSGVYYIKLTVGTQVTSLPLMVGKQ